MANVYSCFCLSLSSRPDITVTWYRPAAPLPICSDSQPAQIGMSRSRASAKSVQLEEYDRGGVRGSPCRTAAAHTSELAMAGLDQAVKSEVCAPVAMASHMVQLARSDSIAVAQRPNLPQHDSLATHSEAAKKRLAPANTGRLVECKLVRWPEPAHQRWVSSRTPF